ncbi:predicted protein [Lichtheimia corymbifera JMRC:FSU:9682]|uniref:Major facilitator superfamily (MFS) profile domain-containing protein n=1 Tax=Lichtheimia corymbifera JMRC:FSU:9682 TaxID=1263082 RepID=A0A068RH93_9FUNG|nr:predicted protein [Lichtheimia corymbifera JMRC:FSU:9682]CDH61394.1 predicted protein [Lichtheimia corymbifera JMRC:FSU:9682]
MGLAAQFLLEAFGTKVVAVIAGALTTLGMFLASISTKIYQLYLSQGVCFGSGVSIMYITIINCTLPYFERRRGLAMGILASATGAGGLLISQLVTVINSSLGPQWYYMSGDSASTMK